MRGTSRMTPVPTFQQACGEKGLLAALGTAWSRRSRSPALALHIVDATRRLLSGFVEGMGFLTLDAGIIVERV